MAKLRKNEEQWGTDNGPIVKLNSYRHANLAKDCRPFCHSVTAVKKVLLFFHLSMEILLLYASCMRKERES